MVSEDCQNNPKHKDVGNVLILVLVGYGLWEVADELYTREYNDVLILVLVGYGLWGKSSSRKVKISLTRLNPCFGGIWSLRKLQSANVPQHVIVLILVLVGYGLWDHAKENIRTWAALVLILVLVGYGLWGICAGMGWNSTLVLILVLVGYGLWVPEHRARAYTKMVLILVLVGYGLWGTNTMANTVTTIKSLNPCFGGIWSLS